MQIQDSQTALASLVEVGARMRIFQKDYFAYRDSGNLRAAKSAEREFDKTLEIARRYVSPDSVSAVQGEFRF